MTEAGIRDSAPMAIASRTPDHAEASFPSEQGAADHPPTLHHPQAANLGQYIYHAYNFIMYQNLPL